VSGALGAGCTRYVPASHSQRRSRRRAETYPVGQEPADADAYEEMSMMEIMCGKDKFPGLLPIIRSYLKVIKTDEASTNVSRRVVRVRHPPALSGSGARTRTRST
jgi:hypothetical protein